MDESPFIADDLDEQGEVVPQRVIDRMRPDARWHWARTWFGRVALGLIVRTPIAAVVGFSMGLPLAVLVTVAGLCAT
jgi:hypothetical protein